MTCKNKPQLDDSELLMAVDGVASPEVAMHVSQCSPCSQRAAELATAQRTATAHLFRAACPPSLELGEYHLGLLPAAVTAAIQQHVATCPHCQQELVQLTSFIDAPDPYLRPALSDTIKQRVRVLVARLTHGPQLGGLLGQPAMTPAFASLRGAESGPLTYEAGDAQVILEIQNDNQRAGTRTLVGLVVGMPSQQAEVHLWRNEQRIASITLDVLGSFILDNLTPGQYELFVTSESDEIHIQDLQV